MEKSGDGGGVVDEVVEVRVAGPGEVHREGPVRRQREGRHRVREDARRQPVQRQDLVDCGVPARRSRRRRRRRSGGNIGGGEKEEEEGQSGRERHCSLFLLFKFSEKRKSEEELITGCGWMDGLIGNLRKLESGRRRKQETNKRRKERNYETGDPACQSASPELITGFL